MNPNQGGSYIELICVFWTDFFFWIIDDSFSFYLKEEWKNFGIIFAEHFYVATTTSKIHLDALLLCFWLYEFCIYVSNITVELNALLDMSTLPFRLSIT